MLRSDTSMSAIRRTRQPSSSVTRTNETSSTKTAEIDGCTICYYNRLLDVPLSTYPPRSAPHRLGDENRRRNNKPVFVTSPITASSSGVSSTTVRLMMGTVLWWLVAACRWQLPQRHPDEQSPLWDRLPSLHVILAYAMVKDDYWDTTSDPTSYMFAELTIQITVAHTKLLFLLGFNASDEQACSKPSANSTTQPTRTVSMSYPSCLTASKIDTPRSVT